MPTPSPSFRRSTSSPAALVCRDGTAMTCVLTNLSAGGARLDIGSLSAVPDEFHLDVADLRLSTDVRVVWRSGMQVGVRFLIRQGLPDNRRGVPPSQPVQSPVRPASPTALRPAWERLLEAAHPPTK